jgi:Cu/Ag efflux pump CusA
LQEQIKNIPGAVDVFMQQAVNAPKLNINVDRLKAQELALTAKDVSDNVLLSLSGSGAGCTEFLARSQDEH